ncbi:MAG TPA: hypothetical protein VHG09_14095 [Longimicrobiales bacterium]|nr:hypothetical protein [Longimicrobiales bacterium]
MRSLRPGLIAALAVAVTVPLHAQDAPRGPSAQPANGIVDAVLDAAEWRSIGPANMLGRVTDIAALPSPSRTFYVAAAAGGIWKTTNNGVTFRPLFQNERVAAMGDLAIAPSDTMQIWAGTGEEDSRNSISPGRGIYKSTDGGLTWTLMGLEKTEHIARIIVHPDDPNTVWVAAAGATWRTNPERGLYKTTDGGQTWRLVKFVSDRAGMIDLIMHPRDPNTLFAASWERLRGPYFLESGGPGSALWKSTDGGETWTEVQGGGFPETMKGRIGIDISQSNPNIMYALVEAEAPDGEDGGCRAAKEGGCGLYRSEDGGATWTWMQPQNTRPFYYSQVRVDPVDPDIVYWSSTPVMFSRDGGRTVGTTTVDLHVDHHAMWIDPHDPNRIIVGNDGGIGISFDRGGNYWFPNTFPIGQFYNVSFDMAVPYSICGGLQDNNTWCGPSRRDGGTLDNFMWYQISGGDGFVTQQDPRDPCTVYSESQGGNMGRSNVCTGERSSLRKPNFEARYGEWEDSIALLQPDPAVAVSAETQQRIDRFRASQVRDSIADTFRYNWNTPFLLSPHDPDVFYAGANRVLKSTERGEDLFAISPDLTKADSAKLYISTETTGGITGDATGAETYGTIVSLNESPITRGFLAAGTDDGNVWITRDDGASWTDLTAKFSGLVPDTTYVSRIEMSPHDANRFYVTFDNHRNGDFRPYVFVTRDGGNTFRSIAANLPAGDGPDYVHVVREDPVNPNLLYLGTDVGLYLSLDQGQSWRKWGHGFPTVPVHDLKIHPRDRELIVGTHGRSIWIIDVAPLQGLTPDVIAASEPVLFEPAAGLQYSSPSVGGGYPGQAWFQGDNRPYGAEIIYYSPTESDESVTITIADAQGNVVQTLDGPAEAGVQAVRWNFRAESDEDEQEDEPLSPSERRDSLMTMRRADIVADSLIAAGEDSATVRRVASMLKGEPQEAEGSGGGGGGGGGGGVPSTAGAAQRPWVERAGEGEVRERGGRGRGGFGGMRDVIEAFRDAGVPGMPGAQLGGRGFGGGGDDDSTVDPGTYTVTATIGGRELTTRLQVVRDN